MDSPRSDAAFAESDSVLDFGCGCGRTLTWLTGMHPAARFHGVDVDRDAIAWCRTNLPSAGFVETGSRPPLPYADGHFDVIYAISVFTHLNESLQDAWLAELRRILKPAGILLFTVHGENARKGLEPADITALENSGILHKRSRKLAGIMPDWYHTTWHSPRYITCRASRWFVGVRYETVPDGLQDFVLCRAGGATGEFVHSSV